MTTGRFTAVALALVLRAIVVLHRQPPPPDWKWGTIVAGSLEITPVGYRFELRDYANPEPIDVLFDGTLPDTVCAGQDASIEGRFHGGTFIATQVSGPVCTKGDPCRRFACRPDAERPIECRRGFRFE